jgi:hypothetical protein
VESSRWIGWPQVGQTDESMGTSRSLAGYLAPCHRGLDVRSTSTLKNSNSGNADTTPNSRQRKNYLQTGGLLSYGPNEPDMLSAGSNLRRQDPQERQTRRSPCTTTHEVRPGTQSEDREGPRPDDPAVPPPAGGSGDRVSRLLKNFAGEACRSAEAVVRTCALVPNKRLPDWERAGAAECKSTLSVRPITGVVFSGARVTR